MYVLAGGGSGGPALPSPDGGWRVSDGRAASTAVSGADKWHCFFTVFL